MRARRGGRSSITVASGHCCAEAREEITGEFAREAPRNCHWPLPLVRYIRRRPQKPEGAVISCKAGEGKHDAAVRLVGLVAPSCLASFASTRLAFPMQERWTDRVIAVARCGGEVTAGLVQSKSQQVDSGFWKPAHTFAPLGHLQSVAIRERSECLSAGVPGVDA